MNPMVSICSRELMPRKSVHRLSGPSEHLTCSTGWLRISLGVTERALEGSTPVEKAELIAVLSSSSSQKDTLKADLPKMVK